MRRSDNFTHIATPCEFQNRENNNFAFLFPFKYTYIKIVVSVGEISIRSSFSDYSNFEANP